MTWLGDGSQPNWSVRCQPYIYRVCSSPESELLVGTDGRGGILLGFGVQSGDETVNRKPAIGGVGTLTKVPGEPDRGVSDDRNPAFYEQRLDFHALRIYALSI
jgi:hypothetical protein